MTMANPRPVLEALLRTSLVAFIERAFYTLNPTQAFLSGYHIEAIAHH